MLVLFDIDGTLVLTGGAGLRAFQRAVVDLLGRVEWPEELRFDGRTDPWIAAETYRRLVGRAAGPFERRALLDGYLRHLPGEVEASATYRVLPGTERCLGLLERRGAAIGLATGNLAAGAKIKLDRAGLWGRFPFGGFGSDDEDRHQLTRIGVERGIAHLGTTPAPEQTFVVGDTPRDVEAALSAGAVAVGVATGSFSVDELRAAGAARAYETLDGFADDLERA